MKIIADSAKTLIRKLSRELGFVDSGVATPGQPAQYDRYLSWLSAGHAAGMAFLNTERARACRADPNRLFTDCKSIIVFLARYPSPIRKNAMRPDIQQGEVAAYAWGEDYHSVLVEKLMLFMTRFQSTTGCTMKSMAVTDSAPLMERALAQSAGLGWIGKNSCLISPHHGSFTFIAELLVDILLEPNETVTPDHCGSCQRCVEACPTQCIQPDRTVHSARCISYLTIENRNEIPADLRPLIGNRIFGCDICQSVCPWNQKVDDSEVDNKFLLSTPLENHVLINELNYSDLEYKRIFKSSPILRSKRSGYLRNIAIVLGNQRNIAAIDQLIHTLGSDPDPIVRGAAAWAVGEIGGDRVKKGLQAALVVESDKSVVNEIIQALSEIEG